ncbi:MAG TPA: PDZ domain-containing protein [Vicinamibacterales bacterium]|nr:PDZ domain-containing protein [Vicinamibacterales bacterium]
MKGLMGKVLLAVAVGGLALAALGAAGVIRPTVVWAQDQGLRRLEPQRIQIDGIGGSIGVTVRDVSADEGQRAKLSPAQGAFVTGVETGSPAEKAGIMTGDVIVEFDGERVRSARQLSRLVRESPDDRPVRTAIVRDGNRRTVDLTPESNRAWFTMPDLSGLDRQMRDMARNFEFRYDGPGGRGFGTWVGGPRARFGVQLIPLTDQLATTFGVKGGVMVTTVEAESPAGRAGLKAGDIITAINSRTVNEVSDVTQEVGRAADGGMLALTVTRDRKELKLTATLPQRERPPVRTGRTI